MILFFVHNAAQLQLSHAPYSSATVNHNGYAYHDSSNATFGHYSYNLVEASEYGQGFRSLHASLLGQDWEGNHQ